jgi:hypothetical protein
MFCWYTGASLKRISIIYPHFPFVPFLDTLPSFVLIILIGILIINTLASLFKVGSYL